MPFCSAYILHMMNNRLAPADLSGFTEGIHRLTALFSDAGVEVRQINHHSPPMLMQRFGLAWRHVNLQHAHKPVLEDQLVCVWGHLQRIQLLRYGCAPTPADNQERDDPNRDPNLLHMNLLGKQPRRRRIYSSRDRHVTTKVATTWRVFIVSGRRNATC